MSTKTEAQARKVGILVASILGLALLAGAAYKWAYLPWSEGRELSATSSESQYKLGSVRVATDSFAGYAILRSDEMKNPLKRQGIRLEIKDDGADYATRLQALKNGDVDMAVFTIDSYLLAGAKAGTFPASIVMLIDESKGADAIVAYDDVPTIQGLDNSKTKLVLTPNSPSEFLGRILVSQFSLPAMPENWIQGEKGVDDVYKEFLGSKGKHKAFVMWEPYVMKALQAPGAHVLFSSSELSGYIVDVLVAQRDFLKDNPKLVRSVVETYQRAQYSYQNQTYGMRRLIVADAKLTNSAALDDTQAQKLADSIQWKNTLDNYAAFGLQQTPGVENLEDIIDRIAGVLVKTGAIGTNPVAGKASTLFYNGVLAELHTEKFHPGTLVNVIEGVGPTEKDLEAARSIPSLPALSDAQWSTLQTVGSARVEPLEFVRGSSRLTGNSESDLNELAQRLAGLPTSYVKVVGHARADGDPQANLQLANERAQAAMQRLIAAGVPETRVHAEGAKPTGDGGESQSVTFILGRAPY